jgi:hypothetical protein
LGSIVLAALSLVVLVITPRWSYQPQSLAQGVS